MIEAADASPRPDFANETSLTWISSQLFRKEAGRLNLSGCRIGPRISEIRAA